MHTLMYQCIKLFLFYNSSCGCIYKTGYGSSKRHEFIEEKQLNTRSKSSVGAIVWEHIETWKRLHLLHLLNHFSSRTFTHNHSCSLDKKKHRDNVQWYDQGSSCGFQWNDQGSSWVEDWKGFLGKTYWFVLQELECSWGFGSHVCRTYSAAALRLEIGGFRKQVVEPVNCLQFRAGKSWSCSDQVKVHTRRGS
jgi:hypothetical protein